MNLKELNQLFQRDLEKLGQELMAYLDETIIWKTENQISNSAGNLALHLFGNLRHFIGNDLGGVAYARNREREFSGKGISRESLLEELEVVKKTVEESLLQLNPSRLGDSRFMPFLVIPCPWDIS